MENEETAEPSTAALTDGEVAFLRQLPFEQDWGTLTGVMAEADSRLCGLKLAFWGGSLQQLNRSELGDVVLATIDSCALATRNQVLEEIAAEAATHRTLESNTAKGIYDLRNVHRRNAELLEKLVSKLAATNALTATQESK
jgi:agmatine/peptidylarginine deiminase